MGEQIKDEHVFKNGTTIKVRGTGVFIVVVEEEKVGLSPDSTVSE